MAKKYKVTPWEVSGEIDYDKLIKEFGVKPLDDKILLKLEKRTGELHYFLKRKIFFAHTYFDTILDNVEKGNKFFLNSGRHVYCFQVDPVVGHAQLVGVYHCIISLNHPVFLHISKPVVHNLL